MVILPKRARLARGIEVSGVRPGFQFSVRIPGRAKLCSLITSLLPLERRRIHYPQLSPLEPDVSSPVKLSQFAADQLWNSP